MKHKLKKILLLYLLSGMLFVSCSLEEDYATKKRYEEKMKISHVSFGELLKNKKFSTAYSKVLQQQSLTNKTVMEEQYQFTIANKPVKVIETESATSYTILINRAIDDVNSFENLIVQQLNSGETTANIIKYVPFQPATIESYFLNGDFNGNRTITPIVYNDNLINTTNKITNICSTVCTTLCYDCDPSYSSEYQIPHSPKERCPKSSTFTSCDQVCVAYDDGGGDSSSNLIDITGGGGTGGTTGEVETPPNDSGNNNPIVTAPVLELEEENEENEGNDPCIDLKNKFKPQNENIKPIIDSLKQFINEPDERSVSFKRYIGIDGAPDEYIPYWETGTANTAPVSFGGFWYGSIHTHPFGYDTMFSWQDVSNLLKLYEDTRITNKKIVFNMIVCSNNEVYCIKIDNFLQLKLELKNDWDIPELADCDDALKDAYLVEMMQKVYSKDTNSERAFLKRFANYGISLYKANSNLTNWSKLTVNTPITNSSIVNEQPL